MRKEKEERRLRTAGGLFQESKEKEAKKTKSPLLSGHTNRWRVGVRGS